MYFEGRRAGRAILFSGSFSEPVLGALGLYGRRVHVRQFALFSTSVDVLIVSLRIDVVHEAAGRITLLTALVISALPRGCRQNNFAHRLLSLAILSFNLVFLYGRPLMNIL
jgi:hypothetical protein